MITVKAEVQPDRLEGLATGKPVLSIAELIWNGFDADADRIKVDIERNGLNDIETIRISDNGHGISHTEALEVFRKLGGSWKKLRQRSRGKNRILHGQHGQGRYKAFALGHRVEWLSIYKDDDGSFKSISILGNRSDLTQFSISDPCQAGSDTPGTTVVIGDPVKQFRTLDDAPEVSKELAVRFASSIREYPTVKIVFDGIHVDPKELEERYDELDLGTVDFENGSCHAVSLTIIEWKVSVDRALYFCDENGFAFEKQSPGVHAPDFTFTAYIRSTGIRELESHAAFAWGEGHPDLAKIIGLAKSALKSHFVARRSELAQDLIKEWKEENIYPYHGDPASPVEKAERQVFDVVAKNVRDYLPDFDKTDIKSRKFSLQLLRHAIESSPGDVQRIIMEVLELPKEKASDLAELLERTSLSAMIEASKVIADRLDFLRGLEILLYDPRSKQDLKERSQLQKIIEEQTWIFGEEFALSVADKSLNEVLAKHMEVLGRDGSADAAEDVLLPDGRRGIVDLMLSRRIPQPQEERAEHLVVELKRPSQKINPEILQQIENYALAVAKDERFAGTETIWHFWAVSNDLTESGRDKVSQSDRPFGLYFAKDNPKIYVWSMPWSVILRRCRSRLQFFQRSLEYTVTDENALGYLRRIHEKYLPTALQSDSTEEDVTVTS